MVKAAKWAGKSGEMTWSFHRFYNLKTAKWTPQNGKINKYPCLWDCPKAGMNDIVWNPRGLLFLVVVVLSTIAVLSLYGRTSTANAFLRCGLALNNLSLFAEMCRAILLALHHFEFATNILLCYGSTLLLWVGSFLWFLSASWEGHHHHHQHDK